MTDPRPSAGSRRISLRKRAPVEVPEAQTQAPAAGKGRPTPKRSQARRRRGGPVAPPPTSRREAAKRLRSLSEQDRAAGRPARSPRLLARDAGPVRALVRDLVDGRRNVAVLLLPVALLVVVANLTRELTIISVTFRFWLVTLLAVIVDSGVIAVTVRRHVGGTFPDERARSHIGYALLRSTVVRRFRMPPPQVEPARFRRR